MSDRQIPFQAAGGRSRDGGARSRLSRIAGLAAQAGADELAAEARETNERLAAGTLFVACLGQFKRGKSTLLNALVGQRVLPVGVVPVTAVVTVLRYSAEPHATVHYADGRVAPVLPASLDDYVSEDRNPGNAKGVSLVEVFVPSPLLASGLCLVDTPGVGSVWIGGTEVTRRFIPHVDAALVVFGVDPPVSDDEIRLVADVSRETRQLLFVLNKADKSRPAEIAEAQAFTERVLRQRVGLSGQMLIVSAVEHESMPAARDWSRLEKWLHTLTAGGALDTIRWRERRVAGRLLQQLQHDVQAQHQSLMQPIADTQARVLALQRWIDDAEGELGELAQRMTGQQAALDPVFAKLRDHFLHGALPAAAGELQDRLAAVQQDPHFHQHAMQLAHDIADRRIRAWLAEVEPVGARHYAEVTARFVALANDLLHRLATVEPTLAALPSLESDTAFRIDRGFYFTGLMRLTTPPWLSSLAAAMGVPWGRRRISRQALRYLRRLLEVNSHRTYEDLRTRVAESRRQLESDVRQRLRHLSDSATRALVRARDTQQFGEAAVRAEERRLSALLIDIEREHSVLQPHSPTPA